MGTVPSREKNRSLMPGSFSLFGNCRMVIDCTAIEVTLPGLMNNQKVTHSSYRGMNSFKVLIGVAPNAVITYVSKLYPGFGDLVPADKGFSFKTFYQMGYQ